MFRRIACLLVLAFAAIGAEAASVRLAWDANTEPDLAGYLLRIHDSSGAIVRVIDVGLVTSIEVSDLGPAVWSFDLTAYNQSGLESDPSNMIEWDNSAVGGELPPPGGYRLIETRFVP